MNHDARFLGERVYLRTLAPGDVSPAYVSWINNPAVNKYLETHQATLEELQKYVAEKLSSDQAVLFGIFWKEGDIHIGNIKLEPIEANVRATLGILIGDTNYWGKGVATEAIELVLRFAFDTLRLNEVNLGVLTENAAALRVYEKLGFTVESREKGIPRPDGTACDKVNMVRKKNI